MRKMLSFLAILAVCLLLFWCIDLPELVANAEDQAEEQELTELSAEEYEDYINDLLRPTFFSEIFEDIEASAKVDLGKFDSSNVPSSSGAGSAGSASGLKDFGMEILSDLVLDIANKAFVGGSTRMPDFNQRIGKLRNVYNSGLVEIITCGLTTYQTERLGNLGDPVGTYDDHCILTLTRQIDNYYTVTTICDPDSSKYCDPSATADYKLGGYSPYVTASPYRYFDESTQTSISGQYIPSYGTYTRIFFIEFSDNDLEEMPGLGSGTLQSDLYFFSHDRRGVSEYSSGSQYRTLSYILGSSGIRVSSGGLGRGICFSVANTITNDYQEYSQQQEINNNTEQKQSITYLSELNTTNIINENNIQNYKNMSYDFSSWWQSNVSEVINNNITNIYNQYWIVPTDPPEIPPTDPSVTPPLVTDPSETLPPIISVQPSETVPSMSLPSDWLDDSVQLDTSHYTMDYSLLEDNFLELESLAVVPEGAIKGTGVLFRVVNDIFEETGLLPYLLFIGIVFLIISFFR